MAIRREDVERIAELARLEIPPADLERVRAELSSVLDFVATLSKLDLEGFEPSTFAPSGAPLKSDEPNGRRLDPGTATAGAPEGEDGFFLVPPIVENLAP